MVPGVHSFHSPEPGKGSETPAELPSPARLTSEGFGDPFLLPLPRLVILFWRPLIILRQAGLPGPGSPLTFWAGSLILWFIGCVIEREGLGCSLLRTPDFCQGKKEKCVVS